MKELYLVLCEGSNENVLMNLLIEKNLLWLNFDNLVGATVFHCRQIVNNPAILTYLRMLKNKNVKIILMRIGDKLSDEIIIPDDFQDLIVEQRKYCTRPEFEILIILKEGLEQKYQNNKDCKSFVKRNVKIGKSRYNGTSNHVYQYFEKIKDIKELMKKYKERHTNKKDEYYLYDLFL